MNVEQMFSGMIAGSIVMMLLSLLFCATTFGLFLAALIHCLKHKHDKDRLTWVIVIIFVPLIGAILYFTIGKSQAPSQHQPVTPRTTGLPPAMPAHPMDDEKKRAAAINEALRQASSARRH